MNGWKKTNDLGLIPEPDLTEYERLYGTRYAAVRSTAGGMDLNAVRAAASLAGSPSRYSLPALALAMNDEKCAGAVLGGSRPGKRGETMPPGLPAVSGKD